MNLTLLFFTLFVGAVAGWLFSANRAEMYRRFIRKGLGKGNAKIQFTEAWHLSGRTGADRMVHELKEAAIKRFVQDNIDADNITVTFDEGIDMFGNMYMECTVEINYKKSLES